jgi:2-phospho-L-lactate guanylyltransferase
VRAWALVPQKRLADAKSRIAISAPPETRAAISLALLDRVCTALRATPGVEDVVIMTPDPAVQAFGRGAGVRTISDTWPSFNEALGQALLTEGERDGARAVLVVSADLPLIEPSDVAAALAMGGHGALVLAPSKDGTGTNALLLPPGVRCRPAFGPGSRMRHRRLAAALGLRVVEIVRPGLAFDLDTPADLAALGPRHSPLSARTTRAARWGGD